MNRFENLYIGDDANGNPMYINTAAFKALLLMVFIFSTVFLFGITPLQALYPIEVLSFEQRAKGMAFFNLAINTAGLLN